MLKFTQNRPKYGKLVRSKRLLFCVTNDVKYHSRELMPSLAWRHFLRSVGCVSLPVIRQTQLQYWIEIGRPISRNYHYDIKIVSSKWLSQIEVKNTSMFPV